MNLPKQKNPPTQSQDNKGPKRKLDWVKIGEAGAAVGVTVVIIIGIFTAPEVTIPILIYGAA